MASEKKSFEYFFRKFSLSVAMLTSQNKRFDKIHMVVRGLYQKHFNKNFCQNICSNTEINANFHFFHYKSMET